MIYGDKAWQWNGEWQSKELWGLENLALWKAAGACAVPRRS